MATLIPIDFNSLSRIENGKIALTNYYLDYAFFNEGINAVEGMDVTFHDEDWLSDSNQIICLDATLHKSTAASEPWFAELKGRVYTSPATNKPTRKYFSSFMGAGTQRLAGNHTKTVDQKVSVDPSKDKLSGFSCFVFPHGSPLPDFSKIVGMDAKELCNFFHFAGFPKPQLENGRYPGNTLVVRGGCNKARRG